MKQYEINGERYTNLYTNIGKDYVTKGYKYLEGFEKKYIPIFTYKVTGHFNNRK